MDPFFREQFGLAAATPSYQSFLSTCVPDVFVGDLFRLQQMLQAVAAAMQSTCEYQVRILQKARLCLAFVTGGCSETLFRCIMLLCCLIILHRTLGCLCFA